MTKKGFTLIELMVTITIMIIMTLVVFFNYNSFNESSLMNQFAYDISLTIRQAQVYGVAAKEGGIGTQSAPVSVLTIAAGNFSYPYGVHFDYVSSHVPLQLFIDSDSPNVFDGSFNSSNDTVLQSYSFQRGIKIKRLLITNSTDTDKPVANMDIVFKRPDPEAIISFSGDQSYYVAKIVLQNASDSIEKTVVVYSTGQIAVQ